MTNINELTAKLKAAAQDEIMCREACDTSDLWQDEASPENVLALTEALEAAEKRIAGHDRQCDEQYLLGMATGWNFGLVEDCDGYDATYASRRKLIDAERDAGIKLQIEGE